MYKLLFSIVLFASMFKPVFAQYQEVKAGLFGSTLRGGTYEYVPADKLWSLELSVWLDVSQKQVPLDAPYWQDPVLDSLFDFRHRSLNTLIKYKRYRPGKSGTGLTYGLWTEQRIHLYTDPDYYALLEEVDYEVQGFLQPREFQQALRNGQLTKLAVGIFVGYKFLLWERLVLEANLMNGANLIYKREWWPYDSFAALLELKVGYRFQLPERPVPVEEGQLD